MRIYSFFLFIILFFSCSNQKEKIDFLKKELQIEIPSEVEIIKDEVEKSELLLPDHTLRMTISLNKTQIELISKQIIDFPYYNELEYYRWRDGNRYIMDHGIYNFKTIQDSIAKTKYRGSWIKINDGYEFVDFGKTHNILHSWINTNDNTLKFVFIDM